MPKKTQVRTRAQKRREDVWIVQKKWKTGWESSCTLTTAYVSRKYARDAIKLYGHLRETYRAVRYSPATD